MKTLYPLQKKAFDSCMSFLFDDDKKDSGLAILPTGAGKSVLLAHISKSTKENVLFIVPSIDLLRQNVDAIIDEGGDVGVYSASAGKKDIKPITVATIMSANNNPLEFKERGFKRIIVDEAHYKASEKGVFKDFIDVLKPKKLLGVTATGFKLTSYKGFNMNRMLIDLRPKLFKKIIHVTQVSEVIEFNLWNKIKYVNMPFDRSGLKLNTSKNDYSTESLLKENKEQKVNNRICKELKKLTKNKRNKILVFMDSVENSRILEDWGKDNLIGRCAVVDSDTNKENRRNNVDDFKDLNSDLNVLINHSTFTTGLDSHNLTHIIMGRATNSFVSFYQIVGRLVRRSKDGIIKSYIDFGGNINKFGEIETISYDFIEGYGWCVFCNGALQSGVPLECTQKITKQMMLNPPKLKKADTSLKLDFGKHEGKPLYRIPKYYRDFILDKNVLKPSERNFVIKQSLGIMRENEMSSVIYGTK